MQEYRCNCMRGNIALFPLPELSFFSLFSAFLIDTHLGDSCQNSTVVKLGHFL